MAGSRNPYHQKDGIREVKRSVVAMMDILGFTEMARAAHRDGRQNEFPNSLYCALERGRRNWLEHEQSRWTPKDDYSLKAFTDNIVIGWPISSDGEVELGSAFSHLEYYGSRSGGGSHAPQNRDLLQDADGQWFLNYLDNAVLPEEDDPTYVALEIHKKRVEEQLHRHRSRPAIWSKYAWVARYHNCFCDLHPDHFRAEHKIEVRSFELWPSPIIDPRRKRQLPRLSALAQRRREKTQGSEDRPEDDRRS